MIIRELSISGGGVRGFGFFGALYCLWKKGILVPSELKTVASVSVGSWLGAGLCLGFTPQEMGDYFFELDLSVIQDIDLTDFFGRKSLMEGKMMKKMIEEFISQKEDPTITLGQLFQKSKIHLILTTICLNTSSVVYLDHINNPDLELAKAILMSSSIPGVFPPVEHQNQLYIDGGIIDNNPLHLLSDEAWGICQDSSDTDECIIDNMFDYTRCIIQTVYTNVCIIKGTTKQKIIKIKTDNIPIVSFKINKDVKYGMIKQGIISTTNQINHMILHQSLLQRFD